MPLLGRFRQVEISIGMERRLKTLRTVVFDAPDAEALWHTAIRLSGRSWASPQRPKYLKAAAPTSPGARA